MSWGAFALLEGKHHLLDSVYVFLAERDMRRVGVFVVLGIQEEKYPRQFVLRLFRRRDEFAVVEGEPEQKAVFCSGSLLPVVVVVEQPFGSRDSFAFDVGHRLRENIRVL